MGNYKDSKLEVLAKRGNGNFAYLDCEREAEKVLIEEFAQTVYTVANDVYLNVKFNPDLVKEYKLIGFDNPENAISDSSMELEGGEVGSGHSLLAVFEVVPTGNNLHLNANKNNNLASLNLSYKELGENEKKNFSYNAPFNYVELTKADSSLRFASSVIMFGGLLKQCSFAKNIKWDDVKNIALTSSSKDDLLQTEFLEMVEKAKKIYSAKKK
jgi:Ca-activated chloride channel family protein